MTTDTQLYPDPVTGEAIELDAWLSAMADAIGEQDEAIARAQTELAQMHEARRDMEAMILEVRNRGQGAAGVRYRFAVTGPSRRPPRSVNPMQARRYREQYEGLGYTPDWKPPTVAWHVENEVALINAGVPLDEVLPDPGPGSPRIVTEAIR